MNMKTYNKLNNCLNKMQGIKSCAEKSNLINLIIKDKKFNIIPFKNKYYIEVHTKEFGCVVVLDSEKELTPKYFDSVKECKNYIRENFKEI